MSFAFNFVDDDVDMADAQPSTPKQSVAKPGHLPRTPSITILDAPQDEANGRAPPEETKVKCEKIAELVCIILCQKCDMVCFVQKVLVNANPVVNVLVISWTPMERKTTLS